MGEVQGLGDELVSAIYAAMLGEAGWQAFLDKLNLLCPEGISTFFHHDVLVGTGATTLVTAGYEQGQREYESYYGALNPWMKRVALTPLGEGVVGEQVVAHEDFARTEYYNDFIRPIGFETGIGLTLRRDNGRYLLLSTLTRKNDVDANLAAAAVLTQIAPHLDRVFSFYRRNHLDAFAMRVGDAVADAGNVGLIIVDDTRAVVNVSREGERILAEGRLIALSPMGRLRFRNDAMQAALETLIASPYQATRMEVFAGHGCEVRLLRIHLDHTAEFFAGPRVAILVTDQSVGPNATHLASIAARYQLSGSERRVFEGIASGQRVSEIAEKHGLAEATVRTQLKAVFAKTNTHSQADLVRLSFNGASL